MRDEHGYTGGNTSVKHYVRGARIAAREMFVPLIHPQGHAQVVTCLRHLLSRGPHAF